MRKIFTLEEFIRNHSITSGYTATRVLDDGREQDGLLFKDDQGNEFFVKYGKQLQKQYGSLTDMSMSDKNKIRVVCGKMPDGSDSFRIYLHLKQHSQTKEKDNSAGQPIYSICPSGTKKVSHKDDCDEEIKDNLGEMEKMEEGEYVPPKITPEHNPIINKDYIGVVRERNLLLEYHEFNIPQYYDILLEDLKSLLDDEKMTILDIQNRFTSDFSIEEHQNDRFSYVFPYEYNNSFITLPGESNYHEGITTTYPKLISREEYDTMMKQFEIDDMHLFLVRYDVIDPNNTLSPQNIIELFNSSDTRLQQEDRSEYLAICRKNHDSQLKKDFMNKTNIPQYILAYQYKLVEENIQQLSDVKLYSTEQCGWKDFEYKIDNDITILVHTNFAFGASSYFHYILRYKNVDILPYTAIIEYYYAEMQDMRRCTKSYDCDRKSWSDILNQVVKTVNTARGDLSNFENRFIVSEIEKMMLGLRSITRCPEKVIEKLKKRTPEKRDGYIFVRSYSTEDKELYEILPEEKLLTDKIYKVSSALEFLDNLKKLSSFLPQLSPCISELVTMNIKLIPEINNLISKINTDIDKLMLEKRERFIMIENSDTALKPYIEEIITKYESNFKIPVSFNIKDLIEMFSNERLLYYGWEDNLNLPNVEKEYKASNQKYSDLINRRSELSVELKKIEKHLLLRNNLINVLQDSKQRIQVKAVA